MEVDLGYTLAESWKLSTGVRYDLRKDRSQIAPATQEQGERTDAVAQLTFDPGGAWRTYGFVQRTIASSLTREQNSRVGAGGSLRLTQRFRIDGEISDGDLGTGGRLGTSYLLSERSSLYLNYGIENERTDNGRRMRRGDFVSGAKTRLSDSSSVYVEERYQNGDSMTGLTHATGVNLVTKERWNFGANTEIGRLRDSQTGARTDRKAAGGRVGYGLARFQASSAVEYRRDNAEQPNLMLTERTLWLFRNNFEFKLARDWRVLGKLDHSISESSLGDLYGGGYTEGVLGYAYRPVKHNRFNALAKYTYFFNVPTTDQVNFQNATADFIQRSHIAALDFTVDLTRSWSVGGKYAYRLGEVSLDRALRNFLDNTAQLGVLRVDWRFRKNWESLAEARVLDLRDIRQRRQGALASIYRYLGPKMKVGIGYNFTEFSDDLTDLSFDHKGVFLNLIVTQ
jgi:lipopolysaccharide assembly outer membrane protein LptD (OstA)